jgi:uncharacterized linocin/CFP29 family protein
MNTLRYVGSDEFLKTEQGLTIKESAVFAARRAFVGRKLFGSSIRKIDSGAQTYGYDTLTEVAAASLDFNWPGRLNLDDIGLARSTVAIPNLHTEFEINKLDLASSQMSGTPVNTTTSDSKAYKLAFLEDSLLLDGFSQDGGTHYEINGLYQAAGNSEATDLGWGTVANIITSINNAKTLLLNDNINPPYNLAVNPAQYEALFPLIANTAVSYRQWVEQALEGGYIVSTPALTAGHGVMVKADPAGAFEYVLAEDFTTQLETTDVKSGSNLFGRHYIRGLPVFYDSNAVCKLTDIGGS